VSYQLVLQRFPVVLGDNLRIFSRNIFESYVGHLSDLFTKPLVGGCFAKELKCGVSSKRPFTEND